MERPAEKIPPLLCTARSRTPPQALALILALLFLAKFSADIKIPFLVCSFKAWTGLPCAFCGGTRAFRSLAHFHFLDAFWWNPLATLAALAVFLWFVLWAFAPAILNRITHRLEQATLWPYAITLLILNWIFLLKYLPR